MAMSGERVSVHFPGEVLSLINKTHEALKQNGISRNLVISEATRIGLPGVLKKLRNKKTETPFSRHVQDVAASLDKGQDITTEVVCQMMRERGFNIEDAQLISRVSQYLRRLEKRRILRLHKKKGLKCVYRKA